MRGDRFAGRGTLRRRFLLVWTPLVVWCPVAWCHSIELDLAVPDEPLSLNEPLVATLVVRNTSGVGMYLDLDDSGRKYVNVNVVGPEGDSAYVTADAARACFDCMYTPLAPGNVLGGGVEVSGSLVLDMWHRFGIAGKYQIYVELQRQAVVDVFAAREELVEERAGVPFLQVREEDVEWLEEPVVRSNAVTVAIGRRDETRLRTVAGDLLAAAKAGDYTARLALAWMIDVVAVPSLTALIGLDAGYGREVSAAIERTASSEAVDVLLLLGEPSGALARARVRHGLERIASNASIDPETRRRAEQAIERERRGKAD